jgi:hypothetical protein
MQVMWEWKVVKDVTLHYESKFIQLYLFMHQSACNLSKKKIPLSLSLSLHATLLFASYYTILEVKSDIV